MDITIKEKFLAKWKKYFNGAELPIVFYYTNEQEKVILVPPPGKQYCLIAELAKVRRGKSLCFERDSLGCGGAKRYLGFTEMLRPEFEYFLSCGIPGKLEGERYKKTPELVKTIMANAPKFTAPARYIIFKRWDFLEEQDKPDVAIFF